MLAESSGSHTDNAPQQAVPSLGGEGQGEGGIPVAGHRVPASAGHVSAESNDPHTANTPQQAVPSPGGEGQGEGGILRRGQAEPSTAKSTVREQEHPEPIFTESHAERIGHYKLLQKIGEGGFGVTNAVYRMRYADGQEASMPVVYGHHIRSFLVSFDPKDLLHADTKVGWSGTNPGGEPIRLFMTSWKNPRPEATIESLDFEKTSSGVAPFLFAITAEP